MTSKPNGCPIMMKPFAEKDWQWCAVTVSIISIHIPLYVNRGLHFQAFDRFYNAIGEFLQALFIAHRTYPIAYDKWIREQVEEILGLTELYRKLVKFFEITSFESQEIAAKAEDLAYLLNTYASE